ncbi:MAG: hypothetical protein LBQ22_11615 [Bacteroidales bacterium]|jgi:hypothetical protein|nr:hypothetical protein [Bacteroidales bacterium]
MKAKDIFNFLINPFNKFAGWQAFGIGLIFLLISGYVGALSGVYFDGVIDAHFYHKYDYKMSIVFIVINIISLTILMSLAGILFSKKFRFIDILGTMTLAQAPSIFIALLGFLINEQILSDININPFAILNYGIFIIYTIACLPFIIWKIVLMYYGFSVSCNIKGTKNMIIFITILVLSEILSKILAYAIYFYI